MSVRSQISARALRTQAYKRLRKQVIARDGMCVYCGSTEELQVDHIIARKNGGGHSIENLQTLCKRCNQRKSAKDEAVFLRQTATPPVSRPRLSPSKDTIGVVLNDFGTR